MLQGLTYTKLQSYRQVVMLSVTLVKRSISKILPFGQNDIFERNLVLALLLHKLILLFSITYRYE
jgi:hypothetical protein